MIGASRDSLDRVQQQLRARKGDLSALSSDLFAVAATVAREPMLLQTLADGGQPTGARQALVREVLAGKVTGDAIDVLADVVAARWSGTGDLIAAIEVLAAQAAFMSAGAKLTGIQDEVFLFGRVLDASAQLQMALTDPSTPAAAKSKVVTDLLTGKVDPLTLTVLAYFAANLRGRRVDAVIDELSQLAAAEGDQVVAEVRSVVELTADQRTRLAAVLERMTGKSIRLNTAIDPSIVGGVSVQIGEDIIDGTFTTRLAEARRALLA